MKTLQQQYLLIKEGKGNKEQFLKHARYLFPEFITVNNDYNTTTGILKGKGILTEAVGGIATLNPNKPDWFKIFDTNLREAVGVKDKEEYGDQNKFEASKETEETLKKANFDNADPKNIDNLYGQSFLLGYLTEMWDEKNADKTVGELKDIVAKNMAKDINYYHTEASFGVKGIGYKKDVVGGGDPVAPKGKYKSSGYGDMPKAKIVKEGKDEDKIAKYKKYTYTLNGKKVTPDDIAFYDNLLGAELNGKVYKMGTPDENGNVELRAAKGKTGMYTESLNEGKRPSIEAEIKEIEKSNEALALEAKIKKIEEAIKARESKLQVAESEDLAEMIDPKMVKTLQQEIKKLEGYKAKAQKMYEKMTKTKSKEVIKDEEITENENPYYDSDPSDGDYESNQEDIQMAKYYYDKGLTAYGEGDYLKADDFYQRALNIGSHLGWTEMDLPPYEKMTK